MSALPTSPRPPEGAGVNSLLPRSRRHLRDICLVSGAWSWPLRRLPSPDSCVSLRGWPAVPSNTVAQESRREPSGRAGLLCTHLSGVRVHQTLVSLAACAVCVCVWGGVQNGVRTATSRSWGPPENSLPCSEPVCCFRFSSRGHGTFPPRRGRQHLGGNFQEGVFPNLISAGRVTYFNLSVLQVKPATVFSPTPFSIENLPIHLSVN